MRVLVAPDKFKGSLNAQQVCNAIQDGIRDVKATADITLLPMADGGEGSCSILTNYYNGSLVELEVTGPRNKKANAFYGIARGAKDAFIEMSQASGLMLLTKQELNPLKTSTIGTGELILDAARRGAHKIFIGIGGSATNDAGIGMASVLGYTFLDSEGRKLLPIGENLLKIASIVRDEKFQLLNEIEFTVLCDVTNPLYGEHGAAKVFAPQKGADAEMVDQLDAGLKNFANVVHQQFGVNVNFSGAGAAGGMGAGCLLFLKAKLVPGIDHFFQTMHVESEIAKTDLIITGEGKLDSQTLSGKVVSGILALARKHQKPCLVVVGKSELGINDPFLNGAHLLTLVDESHNEHYATTHAPDLLRNKVRAFLNNNLEFK